MLEEWVLKEVKALDLHSLGSLEDCDRNWTEIISTVIA